MGLLLGAIALLGSSGLPGLFLGRRSSAGQRSATLLIGAGAGLGLWGAGRCLWGGLPAALEAGWFLPWGSFHLKADALSAFFLLPVFLIPALGSLYGRGYWRAEQHPANARALQFYTGILAASMALVVLAQDSVLFLIAWELMALSAYLLATADATDSAACRAGWLYLVGAHVGAVVLLALFALLYRSTGSFALDAIRRGGLPSGIQTGIFLLALIGFGLKVGLVPLHLFLPGAPSHSPSHVSALLSGVVYKVGLYALLRITGLVPVPPAWWGGGMLGLGAASAVLGVTLALAQPDLKRALAYSSFENVGIIVMGLGLALLGRAGARPDWIVLGLGGALFHSWNHALLKPLLFLAAGAVERAAHTTDIDRLGGLAKALPRTATLFMIGAAGIAGLPPLNGFTSELLIYLGLFRTAGLPAGSGAGSWPLATLGVPCLALAGALALACFVNLFGSLFLGQARTPSASETAGDPPRTMMIPMVALAGLSALLGLAPGIFFPVLDRAIRVWEPSVRVASTSLSGLVPGVWLSAAGISLLALLGLVTLLYLRVTRTRPVGTAGTWDCGYARPSPRMEYTGSSFAHSLRDLFRWVLWPRRSRPQVAGLFPKAAHQRTVVEDPVLDRLALPGAQFLARSFSWLRLLQQGRLQVYVLYFFIITVLLLVWGRSTR